MEETETRKKKKRMPTGMYVGSAWIGLAIFMLMCWILSFITINEYVRAGIGNVANFMTILILIAIFGFCIPMLIGIRTLRRAKREAQQQTMEEQMEQHPGGDDAG